MIIGDNKILTVRADEIFWRILKAKSISSGDEIWFNILAEDYSRDTHIVSLFEQAILLNTNLVHPNILKTYKQGVSDNVHYGILESFNGTTLDELVKDQGPLDEESVVEIMLSIARAFQFCHISGGFHGALTASSVFINSKGRIKITNFGFGPIVDYAMHTLGEEKTKFARYFAPERFDSPSEFNVKSEIYSVGILTYYLLTGQLPYDGDNIQSIRASHDNLITPPQEYNSSISDDLDVILAKMLRFNADDRYKNFMSLLDDLEPSSTLHFERNKKADVKISKFTTFVEMCKNLSLQKTLLPGTMVGSKRRIIITVVSISLVFIMFVLGVLLTELSNKDETKYDRALYEEFIAEMEQTRDNDIIESGVEPDREEPRETIETDIVRPPVQEKRPSRPKALSVGQTATISVSAMIDSVPVQATILQDNKVVAQTSGMAKNITLPAGRTTRVTVRKDGYQDWHTTIRLEPNESKDIVANLQPKSDAKRQVVFQTVPFADKIIIDDQATAFTLPYETELTAGFYQLEYRLSNSPFTWKTRILFNLDSENIRFDLKDVGVGYLSVVIDNAREYGYAFIKIDNKDIRKTTPYKTTLAAGRHSIQVYRQGYEAIPSDTTVTIRAGEQMTIKCRLKPR